MFSIQLTAEKINASFTQEEKIALLRALQNIYNIDNVYDVIELIGYESIKEQLMMEIDKDLFQQTFDTIQPIEIFKNQKEKQLFILGVLFDAAIVDNKAHQNEAIMIVEYAQAWNISLQEFKNAAQTDPLQLIELGLFEAAQGFIKLVEYQFAHLAS